MVVITVRICKDRVMARRQLRLESCCYFPSPIPTLLFATPAKKPIILFNQCCYHPDSAAFSVIDLSVYGCCHSSMRRPLALCTDGLTIEVAGSISVCHLKRIAVKEWWLYWKGSAIMRFENIPDS